MTPAPWHALSCEETLRRLEAGAEGLSDAEAAARLKRFGPNTLTAAPRRGALRRFLAQFDNVLIYVLLGSAAVTAFLGHWVDTSVILGVVVINAIIGFLQEGKAENAMEAIRGLLSPKALVLRQGKRQTVAAGEVVPGDVVLLQSGDRVPADLRLLQTKGLAVQEAALTGESLAVEKDGAAVTAEAPLGERPCMVFAGTLVVRGQGKGVVAATGTATEIGRIGTLLAQVDTLETPLVRSLGRFAQVLTVIIGMVALATFAVGAGWRGYPLDEMFLAAVGLAVAAIPEGLPAIVTIALAIGVERMARRRAIVRRLPAVETLGSVTVICTDKTGTLTCNEMTAETVALPGSRLTITGAGYAPDGGLWLDGQAVTADAVPGLTPLLQAAALCNDAELHHGEGGWRMEGDPTEGALMTLAVKAGVDVAALRLSHPRVDVIPFESEHRFMATLHRDHRGGAVVMVKGAPEVILPRCVRQTGPDGDERLDEGWPARVEAIAADGQRALALAMRRVPDGMCELTYADVAEGLTLVGLVGLSDPPRPEAMAAVADCRRAGIAVKMITGDHAATAGAIGARLGLASERVVAGPEIDAADDEALRELAGRCDIFARATPEHKLRLVRALQATGQVVAMTGDGVNDAPALRRADVGVAMGAAGTEAAKEAAEIVLADDNFATIAAAVEEGRRIYDNIRKAIVFILPTNGGEALVIVLAILMGATLPITPVQILWVNMITAVTLALALAFAPPEDDLMSRPPRSPGSALLTPFLAWRVVFVALLLVVGTFGLFEWSLANSGDQAVARTMAVNALVAGQAGYLLNMRRLHRCVLTPSGLLGDRIALAAIALVITFQALFTHWGPMQALFDTRALSPLDWALAAGCGLGVMLAVEVEKVLTGWFGRYLKKAP